MDKNGKKLIWLITYNFGSVKAGPVIRFMRYAPLLLERGVEILFVTKLREGESEYNKDNHGISSLHIPCDSIISLTKKAIQRAIGGTFKPDSLIFFTFSYRNYFDLYKAKLSGIKLFYVSTMRLNTNYVNEIKKRTLIKRVMLLVVFNRLYGLMTAIVSSTSELKQDLLALRIAEDKLKVICNGVNVSKFSPVVSHQQNLLRERKNLPKDKYVFLYVGLFIDRKGVDQLIKTFIELRKQSNQNFLLLMVGHEVETEDVNSDQFNKEWPLLKEEAINEGWLITNSFQENIHEYFQLSDAFVFMSKIEGMPNVILEAMSCGLPIVTYRFDGFSKDYGQEGVHFKVFNGSIQNDVKALILLMNDKELYDNLSSASRQKAVYDFDINKSIDKYVSLTS